jgi:hypothetical protein
MSDESHGTNGKASHGAGAPGLLYRCSFSPEQLTDSALLSQYVERLEQELIAVWKPSNRERYAPITPESLAGCHGRLLRNLEPKERVGRFRQYKEQSSYVIFDETARSTVGGAQEQCVCPGVEAEPGAHRIKDVLKEACDAFQSAVEARPKSRPRDISDAVRPCAELYVAILKARPFLVANDPVAYVALQSAYRHMGLQPLFYSPRPPSRSEQATDADIERAMINLSFNRALARSLRPDAGDIDELIGFLAMHARFQ